MLPFMRCGDAGAIRDRCRFITLLGGAAPQGLFLAMLDLTSSSGERSMCGQALACPSHPVGLKDRVDGLLSGRWDAVLASEGSHFAGEPVQFEAVSRLKIVCHRGSHHWRKSRHQSIQLYRKVRRKLDAGCATYSHRPCISLKKKARMCSSSRMTPRGWRVLAVMPDVPERTTNFFQISRSM